MYLPEALNSAWSSSPIRARTKRSRTTPCAAAALTVADQLGEAVRALTPPEREVSS
jgi:hypothetical protein